MPQSPAPVDRPRGKRDQPARAADDPASKALRERVHSLRVESVVVRMSPVRREAKALLARANAEFAR